MLRICFTYVREKTCDITNPLMNVAETYPGYKAMLTYSLISMKLDVHTNTFSTKISNISSTLGHLPRLNTPSTVLA